MTDCEECGELCADGVKACPWSGLTLCAECAYDEGIQAEDRYLDALEKESTER